MILKGSQRGGALQMAKHLLNGAQNEHVTIHETRGFVASSVTGALNEAYAQSKGTKCKQFMFSLSLNPPPEASIPVEVFEEALERVEKQLGLAGQPRVLVFHEKDGRRHAHCVWSRIDAEEMTAVKLPYFKNKLKEVSKSLFLDHGWELPKGFIDKSLKSPLNYTRAEWQKALRTGQNPKAIKAALQESWAISDCRKSFKQALSERGYFLARGDRRGHVAVDVHGEVYALPRQLGLKAKDVKARLGDPKKLPSVADTKTRLKTRLSGIYTNFLREQKKEQDKALRPLVEIKRKMTRQHRKDRAAQKAFQDKRWQKEEQRRAAKIRRGFKGVWDKVSGKYWKQRKINERETWQAHIRDRAERQELIERQLEQRQQLQTKLGATRKTHENERANLIRDLSQMVEMNEKQATPSRQSAPDKTFDHTIGTDGPEADIDHEPEI